MGKIWDSYGDQGAGAYDSARQYILRSSVTEFTYWAPDDPGLSNRNVSLVLQDPSSQFNLSKCWGLEYDQVRDRFVLWEGDASVWKLQPPERN